MPIWYSWQGHLFVNFLLIGAAIVNTAMAIDLSIKSVAYILLFFHLWAVIEYLIHRFILHGRWLSGLHFKKQHSLYHHGYFTHQHMTGAEPIDIHRILLFTYDLLVVMALNAVLAYGVGAFTGKQYGILFFLSGQLYLLAYEVIHALCHASAIQSSLLTRNHRQHHDPSRMSSAYFSVVLPYIDTLFGTNAEKPEDCRV